MCHYYQVGGFRGHTIGWCEYDDNKLSREMFATLVGDRKDVELELVLGILPNGSSYLLVPAEQMSKLQRLSGRNGRRLSSPYPAAKFASLSPIKFRTESHLVKKIKSYNQKPKKKRKSKTYTKQETIPQDTSQANRAYVMIGNQDFARASFEHQRVLYLLLRRSLDYQKLCLPHTTWATTATIRALSFHTWDTDMRPRAEKDANPKLLDIGWVDVPCSLPFQDVFDHIGTSTDFVVKENSILRQSSDREACKFGDTEILDKGSISLRLSDIFQAHSSGPIFLLVYDEGATLNVLRSLNVDVSRWQSGIKLFFDYAAVRPREEKPKTDPYEGDYPDRKYSSRAYSEPGPSHRPRSPSRYGATDWGSNSRQAHSRFGNYDDKSRRRSRSPVPRHREQQPLFRRDSASPPPTVRSTGPRVFLIDIHKMYLTLRKSGNKEALLTAADRLRIPVNNSWCAGNDCRLLLQMWQSMASDTSIDEQRIERWPALETITPEGNPSAPESKEVTSNANEADLSDDERDPNDIPVASKETGKKATQVYDYLAESDDDDYDYD